MSAAYTSAQIEQIRRAQATVHPGDWEQLEEAAVKLGSHMCDADEVVRSLKSSHPESKEPTR